MPSPCSSGNGKGEDGPPAVVKTLVSLCSRGAETLSGGISWLDRPGPRRRCPGGPEAGTDVRTMEEVCENVALGEDSCEARESTEYENAAIGKCL